MAQDTRDEPLNERAQQLLRVLIENYIRDGQPVGSRVLSRDSGLSLSSATIRNVMADLEELGFVTSPHTSAGRVPTDKGYRFFVDTLLHVRPLDNDAVSEIRRQFDTVQDGSKALVAAASQLLSSVTRLAGVVTLPRSQQASVTQIEFVGLSENRVLVVLVFNDREVQNRIIQLERYYSPDELKRASNFLNEQVRGRTLAQVRAEILRQIQEAHEHMNQLMVDAIAVAQKVFEVNSAAGRREPGIRHRRPDQPHGRRRDVERRAAAPPVRGVQREARLPEPARPQPEGRGRADLHRARVRLSRCWTTARVITAPYAAGDSVDGRARCHRSDPHGLRAGDPHRRHDRQTARAPP